MMKAVNILEYLLIGTGLAVSISDISDILCVILLIIDSAWLFLMVLIKICKALKDGEFSDEELEDIESEIKKKDERNNER